MGNLVEDAATNAEWIAEALNGSGYAADFSPLSLTEIDRFFDEHSKGGKPKRRGLLSNETGPRLFAVGAYVGEVVRRSIGGEWRPDDNDPEDEIGLTLVLPDNSEMWPVQRVLKRFRNGAEDSIAAYGAALGLDVPVFGPARTRRSQFGLGG